MKALVVFSGGQDSTTCLYWAKEKYDEVHAVTFDYGQRHRAEIEAAVLIANDYAGVDSHEVILLGDSILASDSPLVSNNELEQYSDHASLPGGLEKTFVPMRNQLFLTVAANRAYAKKCNILVTGVAQEDFGGYPDCRPPFIESIEKACNLGTFTGEDGAFGPLVIMTPLMNLSKAKTVQMAMRLYGCYEALSVSHTSYDGKYPPTGKDHATLLRQKGFEEAGVPDPLVVRAWFEGAMSLPLTLNYDVVREYDEGTAQEHGGVIRYPEDLDYLFEQIIFSASRRFR